MNRLENSIKRKKRIYEVRRLLEGRVVPAGRVNEDVVVSLTTFEKRLPFVSFAIASIMLQEVRPFKIELWLGPDLAKAQLPNTLLELQKYGVELHYCNIDIKGHKKYFWSIQENNDKIIITIDDDVIYPKDTISTLLSAHERSPKAVFGRRVHKIIKAENGDVAPYRQWKWDVRDEALEPGFQFLATGVGGVLYPPMIFDDETFNLDSICRLALNADDIWLKACELRCGIKVGWAKNKLPLPYEINESQIVSLKSSNWTGGNDKVIKLLMNQHILFDKS